MTPNFHAIVTLLCLADCYIDPMTPPEQSVEMNPTQKMWAAALEAKPDPIVEMAHQFILRTHEQEEDMSRLLAQPQPEALRTEYTQQASMAKTLNGYFRHFKLGLEISISPPFMQRVFESLLTWRKAHPELDQDNPLAARMAATLEEAKAMHFFEKLQAIQKAKGLDSAPTTLPSSHSR